MERHKALAIPVQTFPGQSGHRDRIVEANHVDTRYVTVGAHRWNIVADPVKNEVYTGVSGANEGAVLEGGRYNRVITDIPVGQSPQGMALGLPTHTLLVNDSVSNQVTVVGTRTNRVTQTLPTGRQPQGLAMDTKTGTAYVVNQASVSVTVLIAQHQ